MKQKQAFLFSIWILTLLVFKNAFAATFNPVPFPDTVEDAPVIVRGRIGIHYSDWGQDPEGTKRLYTYYELIPSETFKGQVSSLPSITIRELGGEKDGLGMQIPGTAQFEKNEDVVVFLKKKNKEGVFDVHGMMMGKFSVYSDSNQDEYIIGPAITQGPTPHSENRWSLKDLRQLIKKTKTTPPSKSTEETSTPQVQAPQLQQPFSQAVAHESEKEHSQTQGNRILFSLVIILILLGALSFLMRLLRSKRH